MKWQKVGNIAGRPGEDGKDAPAVDIEAVVEKVFSRVRVPEDGKDADAAAIAADVLERVTKVFDSLPVPKDGKPGEDGKDADSEAIAAEVLARVMKTLPIPKDGAPGPAGKDAAPINLDEVVAKVLDKVPKPDDGIDGRDGLEGPPGQDALQIEILPEIDLEKAYRRGTFAKHAGGLWRAFESTSGMKGWECVVQGVASIQAKQADDDPRLFNLEILMSDGAIASKDFRFAVPLDCGIYKQGSYQRGDGVTYGGSFWIAQKDTEQMPASGADWRLAVKRGKDRE